MGDQPVVPESWHELAERMERETAPGARPTVYLLGGTDSGKTTLCRHLVARFARWGPAARLDCDPGQSALGPPTTLGLTITPSAAAARPWLRFVGSTTPVGHLLQTLVGARRLAGRAAAEGAAWRLIDPPGMVAGETGREFQHQMIDLLEPDWLVVLGDAVELEPIVAVFEARHRPRVLRLPIPAAVTARSGAQRAAYRAQRFEAYFEQAARCELDLTHRGLHGHLPRRSSPAAATGRLLALCDREGFVVVLAIVEQADWHANHLTLHAPPFDAEQVASVQFGTCQMDPP